MDVVGRYRIERQLGAGAFSTVWLAHDDALDIPVALKVLTENWVGHSDVRSRFLDEARLLRRISDPRIVGVHDIGQLDDGRDFFVMDYAAGGSLDELCRTPVSVPTALRLGTDLALAVAVLHEHGILHRDLKPANVLLADSENDPWPLIADLGTAKRLAEASGLTMAAGTPAYMAPEQARGLGLDQRTDVYGVAAVCYRMIAGEVPFGSEPLTAIAQRAADRQPDALPADADLPNGVEDLLRSALATDPDRRPASAADFAEELQTLAGIDLSSTIRVPARRPARAQDPEPSGSAVAQRTGGSGVPSTMASAVGIGAAAEPATQNSAAREAADHGAGDQDRAAAGRPTHVPARTLGGVAVLATILVVAAAATWLLLSALITR